MAERHRERKTSSSNNERKYEIDPAKPCTTQHDRLSAIPARHRIATDVSAKDRKSRISVPKLDAHRANNLTLKRINKKQAQYLIKK